MPIKNQQPAYMYGLSLLGNQPGPNQAGALGGIERAVQPIIGALLMQKGIKQQETQDQASQQAMADALLQLQNGANPTELAARNPEIAAQFGPQIIQSHMDYAAKAPERAENFRKWEVEQVDASAKDVSDFTDKSVTRRDVANEKFQTRMTDWQKNLPETKAAEVAATEAARQPFALERAAAGRNQINVNTNMPPQNKAFDEQVGKIQGERYGEIVKGADAARSKVQMLQAIGPALADAPFAGAGAETLTNATMLMKQFGLTDADTSNAEVARSLSNQMTMMNRNPAGGAGMPGAMSDADREFLKSTVPGLQNTRGGAQKMVDLAIKLEQRKIEVADMAQRYIEQNGRLDSGFDRIVKQYAEANPLFAQANVPDKDGWITTPSGVRIRERR